MAEPVRPLVEETQHLRRRLLLLGCVLLVVAFAAQLAMDLLWPDADFGALLLVLYLVVKWVGDGLARGMAPHLVRLPPAQEWLDWLGLAVPTALVQAALLTLGAGVARTGAAAFPCALYVIAMGWMRSGGALGGGDSDSLGRRLAAWP